MFPPEASLPVSERVYAMDVTVLDDPIMPTERDLSLIERLGSLMCDPVEVLAITGLTKSQFSTPIIEGAWARGRERFKARLRLMQIDAAATGSDRMLIHLGKQYLEQSERTESKSVTDEDRKERKSVRDKFADVIDRIATERAALDDDARRSAASEKDLVVVGEGQPAPTPE